MGFGTEIKGLLIKDFHLWKRNRKRQIWAIIFPIIIMVTIVTLRTSMKIEHKPPNDWLSEDDDNKKVYSYSLKSLKKEDTVVGIENGISEILYSLFYLQKCTIGIVKNEDNKNITNKFVDFLQDCNQNFSVHI